jgi:hypothetical protein
MLFFFKSIRCGRVATKAIKDTAEDCHSLFSYIILREKASQ